MSLLSHFLGPRERRELEVSLIRETSGVGSGRGICNDGGLKAERGCGDTEVGVDVLVRLEAGVEQLECGEECDGSKSRTAQRLKLKREDIETAQSQHGERI